MEQHERDCEIDMDVVSHPQHYQSDTGIECIEALRAMLGTDGFTKYCVGTTGKYIWRWEDKGGLQDLCKGFWYLGTALVANGVSPDEIVRGLNA